MDVPLIDAHLRARLAATPVARSPMPHAIIDSLVPDSVYTALLRNVPPTSAFSQRDLIKQDWHPGDSDDGALWRAFELEVMPVIAARLVEHFAEAMEARCRQLFADSWPLALSMQRARGGRLMLRRPRYLLQPHRDTLPSMATVLWYLARPDDSPLYGTQVYAVTNDSEASHSKTCYPPKDACTLAADVAFLPNRALVFMNQPGSAHGAAIPPLAPPDTERYSFQAYSGVEIETLKALVQALPPEEQSRWAEKYRALPQS